MVGLADDAERGAPVDPEDGMRIFDLLLHVDVVRADANVVARAKAEMPGDRAKIVIFGRTDPTVGERDVKQPTKQVLEHSAIVGEQTADLAGITLEPGGALAGEIEDQPDVILFARRDLEDLEKSRDLVPCHRPIGSRHLGAERNDGNCKSDAAARVVVAIPTVGLRMPSRKVARHALKQGAERTAEGQLARPGDNVAKKAHWLRSRCDPVERVA